MSLKHERSETVAGEPCARCISMAATLDGLRMLASEDGFEHHDKVQFRKSAEFGCPVCIILGYQLQIPPDLDGPLRIAAKSTVEGTIDVSYTDVDHPFQSKQFSSLCVVNTIKRHHGVQIYTSFDDKAKAYLPVLPDQISVHSPEIVEKIRCRLKICEEQHHECIIQESPILPRRVIDVGTGDVSNFAKLFINDDQMRGDYACLSYCWGGPQEVATTTSTFEQFSERLPWDKLPQTIKDAVTVTRSLAIRFLWVDALCILQDKPDDKSIQIGAMGNIYKNAKVTIAAASSRTVTEGFLKDRNIPNAHQLPFYVSSGQSGSIWLRNSQYFKKKEVDPLESRGWALQESLLSRRTLYYGSMDLMWTCQRERFVSVKKTRHFYLKKLQRGFPTTIFNANGVEINDSIRRGEIWEAVVDNFAGRELTLFEDRLPALAGIASELQNIWRDTYLAGMWQSFLVRQLGWLRDGSTLKDLPPEPYRSPGWSWASSRGHILFPRMVREDAKFIACTVIPLDNGSTFGRVKSGRLTLWAALKSIPPSLHHRCFSMDLGPNGRRNVDQDSRLLLLGYGPMPFAVCLIITPIGDGTYIRVGATKMNTVEAEMWRVPNLRRENVTLI